MIKDIILVGVGSFFGGICRYGVSLLLKSSSQHFPWNTFAVNIIGCFLIGLLFGYINRTPQSSSLINLVFVVGFCGGFTTFSTFSKENLVLLQSGNFAGFATYTLGSVLLGLTAVTAGWLLTR